jgi:hypothetical protein
LLEGGGECLCSFHSSVSFLSSSLLSRLWLEKREISGSLEDVGISKPIFRCSATSHPASARRFAPASWGSPPPERQGAESR